MSLPLFIFFFFNDTATTEIYTLSLHDALPISSLCRFFRPGARQEKGILGGVLARSSRSCGDRKSTRLNSSHGYISYAVFCLKKKKIYRYVLLLQLLFNDTSLWLTSCGCARPSV